MNLADALVPRMYTEGETIIKQGDAADGMYFIEDGTVRVVKVDGNGMEKEVSNKCMSSPSTNISVELCPEGFIVKFFCGQYR